MEEEEEEKAILNKNLPPVGFCGIGTTTCETAGTAFNIRVGGGTDVS